MSDVLLAIDGPRLLHLLGLVEETITPEQVVTALMEQRNKGRDVLQECVIRIIDPHNFKDREPLCFDLTDEPKYIESTHYVDDCLESIRRQLKYEKNPMRRIQLQRELGYANACNGKHRKGRRHC